jgi:UDP-2,3-diacylglucosamine pyrophosphatase LpxH
MTAAMSAAGQRLRTVWISDIHLGSKDCRADYLLDFLRRIECDTLYLLGDIVDFWAMRRQFLWPASHYEVLRLLMQKARSGTRVVYLPGNHDEAVREFVGHNFGPIEIVDELLHITADGRRLLLFHGDALDGHVQLDLISRYLGEAAYDLLMWMHRWVNRGRRLLGMRYWSLASYIKARNGKAMTAIALFRHAALEEARRRGIDGVVCGHIHHAEVTEEDGLLYCNDGDWVESCTLLAEQADGALSIVRWAEQMHHIAPMSTNDDLQIALPLLK